MEARVLWQTNRPDVVCELDWRIKLPNGHIIVGEHFVVFWVASRLGDGAHLHSKVIGRMQHMAVSKSDLET